jgi:glycosyltransferase involved in cell wall biosynthesis
MPLASCIMPTRNRRPFVPQAVEYFARQTYPSRELIVVDDGEDAVGDLVRNVASVRYVRLDQPHSIGAKRNIAVHLARGTIIVHWDDDDWYGCDRLRHQVEPLWRGSAHVSGLKTGYLLDLLEGRYWMCRPDLHARMFYADLHGGTIAYLKSLWGRVARFPDSSLAEDAAFLRALAGRASIVSLPNADAFVYVRHGGNAWEFICGKAVDAGAWTEAAAPACMAPDAAFYCRMGASLARDSTSVKRYGDACRRAGAHDEALRYYDRALELDRNNVWAWFDRGLSLAALGAYDAALEATLEAGRLLHPQDGNRTWLHEELGRLYLRLGRPDAARTELENAVRHWPGNASAREALARIGGDA